MTDEEATVLQQLCEKVDNLYDKLFEDNGGVCLQSKVNSNSQWIKIITGIFAVVGAFILTVVGWIVKSKI